MQLRVAPESKDKDIVEISEQRKKKGNLREFWKSPLMTSWKNGRNSLSSFCDVSIKEFNA